MLITRWIVCKADMMGRRNRYKSGDGHERATLEACVSPWTLKGYIANTQAWRPLDIHPDNLVWAGARSNKEGE